MVICVIVDVVFGWGVEVLLMMLLLVLLYIDVVLIKII